MYIPRDKQKVPSNIYSGLKDYILRGICPGGFVTALLRNDLRLAVAHADDTSLANLHGIIIFLINYTPSACWGSKKNIDEWTQLIRGDKLPDYQRRAIEIEFEEYEQYVLDNND